FYCDRQPCGSALRIKTSINFQQQRRFYGLVQPGSANGSVSVELWTRTYGAGSCPSIPDVGDSVKASNLTYQLLDASGKIVRELANPGTYYGGITIAEPIITVDTSKFTGAELAPDAAYRLVAFESGNPL